MDLLNEINLDLLSLFVQIFLAYHIFQLSKKLSLSQKLENREKLRETTDSIIHEINKNDLNHEVYIVNSKTYLNEEVKLKENLIHWYPYVRAEIKTTKSYWIEFFCDMPIEVYRRKDWKLTFKNTWRVKEFNVFTVWIIPYEWIDFIDKRGDEYSYVPLFHVKFNWKRPWRKYIPYGSPYQRIEYYTINKDTDSINEKYKRINEVIYKS